MCRYCEVIPSKYDWDKTKYGEELCGTKYECANIVQNKERNYYIRICGNYEDFSESISFCPFCGRKLKE